MKKFALHLSLSRIFFSKPDPVSYIKIALLFLVAGILQSCVVPGHQGSGTATSTSTSSSTFTSTTTATTTSTSTSTSTATHVTYSVSPSGLNVTVSPNTVQNVNAGSKQVFNVAAVAGYVLSSSVAGTCPAGSWNGSAYTTGAIIANCSVAFSAAAIAVNGLCGNANEVAVSAKPASALCNAGSASPVTGSGPWAWSCVGSGGGTTASCSAPMLSLAAFYMATNGSDANPGTLEAPFATLGKAQAAMRASATVKTTYIRAGKYILPKVANCGDGESCGLFLGSEDSGETWSYYPPDGVNSADFTGGSTGVGTGLYFAIYTSGSSNLTINGLSIHNFQYAGIGSLGGVTNLTVINNIIFNQYYIPGKASSPGGFTCYGCANTTISHNVIHDMAAWGINLGNVNGNVSNLLVTGNVIYNTCTNLPDCGAIYLYDPEATAKNIRWTNNFVRDGNTSAGTGWGAGLYADDCVSNLTATGNILTGKNGYNTIMIHGGSNVHVTGNLTDLAGSNALIFTLQTSDGPGCSKATMSGNEYKNNIVIGEGRSDGYGLLSGSPLNAPSIMNNDYYNYNGAPIVYGNDYTDSAPLNVNPQISGWLYSIAVGSPVFNAPMNFPAIVGGWGPPGYVIPQTGTAPSSPH